MYGIFRAAIEPYVVIAVLLLAASALSPASTLPADPPGDGRAADGGEHESAAGRAAKPSRLTVDEAREKARLVHNIYTSTLDMLHHRYFNNDRATVPARALHDVFSSIERQERIAAGWIAVNTQAMSIDHRPQTEFEKSAARALRTGRREFELVDGDVYRRAGVIPLHGECLRCHDALGRDFKPGRVAGLIIAVPLRDVEEK